MKEHLRRNSHHERGNLDWWWYEEDDGIYVYRSETAEPGGSFKIPWYKIRAALARLDREPPKRKKRAQPIRSER